MTLPDRCRCQSCSPDDPDPLLTEAYRHSCEVRFVVSLPSHVRRSHDLALVAKARGVAAAQRLRADTWALMRGAHGV
jgi:hypothetical protein